jgi:HK97 gp10 family phage protein
MAFDVKLEGVEELRRAMESAAKSIRTKAVRSALREAGKVIQASAKVAAPVLRVPTKTRTPGTVRKNIAVRASKFARSAGNEGVFVNVRPIGNSKARVGKLGKAGATNPNDPFYWRFLEFGTKKMRARPFLTPAVDSKGNEAIQKFMSSVIPQIEKLNAKGSK